tara:strand:+ start:102 stop:212 length:111 start_codon:yes stop_codon:yes gene_type:complete
MDLETIKKIKIKAIIIESNEDSNRTIQFEYKKYNSD